MKRFYFLITFALALIACNKPQDNPSVLDIITNAQYGETHAISLWAGRSWEFFGMPGETDFEALTTSIPADTFDSIADLITAELGEPTYDKLSFPKELTPAADTGVFWMAWKENDMFFYWCCDTMVVGLSLNDSHPSGIGSAYLYIDLAPHIPSVNWPKGPYETYMDSLIASNPDYHEIWRNNFFFNSSRQRHFVNSIYYADSYKTYLGLLNEYLPIKLSSKASEYDRYLASEVQKDSLLAFPGNEGCTADMYYYASYELSFTRWNIQKFTDVSKSDGLYSVEVDSAWQAYYRAMLTSVDSVVMYRPRCLGTISNMEYVAFVGRLDDDYLYSMLDALYGKQRHIVHTPISDKAISDAYLSLKSHQQEYESKEGFEDLDDCYVPLSERLIALDKDEEKWNAFIDARNAFSQTLSISQRKAYNNATNNLKRNKLWLLKNEYRCYSISPEYDDSLLAFDCSDEELMRFLFEDK